ncbi:histidine kinase [Undibacterium sp. CY18W]|uniref:histidine kinase n=1 Tax=Undibacterium hunanense TaxID=2762292 RepID=A0ABR6ZL82_9BURK|nr:histidine kinase [Undibacterium hunanense]MBC3916656.1 histidine kinase [Undibacterium hunanense]
MSFSNTMSKQLHTSEQLLPSEVTARSETWLTRARNYPVFSRTWFRYRAQAWLGFFAIIDLLVLVIGWLADANMRKTLAVFIPLTLGSTALHLLGPAMAVWVRSRGYAGKKEVIALLLALLLGAACSYGVLSGVNYATQYLVQGSPGVELAVIGSVSTRQKNTKDATGRLTTVTAQASVAETAERPADSKEIDSKLEHTPTLKLILQGFSLLISSGLIFYTGGAVDFWYFFRQKKRMLEVMRQQELQQAQDARREAELRLSVLAAQVEPHFLFNSLAGVRSAILTEPQRATAIVDHLVDYLRATIPQMRNDGSSAQARLKQQLEAASAYLGLMHARIPRLSYSFNSEVNDAALPPLMLISLVENAVKHGVEPKIGPVHIAVHARRMEKEATPMLELTVEDDGVGFAGSSSGSGIGLANIHERLASMYGERASLVLKARAEGGVAATILLPLEA